MHWPAVVVVVVVVVAVLVEEVLDVDVDVDVAAAVLELVRVNMDEVVRLLVVVALVELALSPPPCSIAQGVRTPAYSVTRTGPVKMGAWSPRTLCVARPFLLRTMHPPWGPSVRACVDKVTESRKQPALAFHSTALARAAAREGEPVHAHAVVGHALA